MDHKAILAAISALQATAQQYTKALGTLSVQLNPGADISLPDSVLAALCYHQTDALEQHLAHLKDLLAQTPDAPDTS